MPETYVGWGTRIEKDEHKTMFSVGIKYLSVNWNGEQAKFISVDFGYRTFEIGKIVKEKESN